MLSGFGGIIAIRLENHFHGWAEMKSFINFIMLQVSQDLKKSSQRIYILLFKIPSSFHKKIAFNKIIL